MAIQDVYVNQLIDFYTQEDRYLLRHFDTKSVKRKLARTHDFALFKLADVSWLEPTNLILNLWAPKLNIANFVTQDYSHILHIYFIGVSCCSHPQRNVTLS